MCIVQSANLKNLTVTKRTLISDLDKHNLNIFFKYKNFSLIQYMLGLYILDFFKGVFYIPLSELDS